MADPNWVDPKSNRKVGDDSMGKDGFLQMFLAQLKNQDPTNPMEGHDLAAQLAQFTSLEKLQSIDSSMKDMVKAENKPSGDFQVLNMIGKTVGGDSSRIVRTEMDQDHEVSFTLPTDAARVKVAIRNESNEIIRKIDLTNLKSGKNSFDWNGVDEDGHPARVGKFSVELEAFSHGGDKVAAFTKFKGKVSGVNFTPEGTVLMIGKQAIRMQDVKQISDERIAGSKIQRAANKGLGINPVGASVKESGKPSLASPVSNSNLGDLGFSRGMANKIKKTTGSNQGIL